MQQLSSQFLKSKVSECNKVISPFYGSSGGKGTNEPTWHYSIAVTIESVNAELNTNSKCIFVSICISSNY